MAEAEHSVARRPDALQEPVDACLYLGHAFAAGPAVVPDQAVESGIRAWMASVVMPSSWPYAHSARSSSTTASGKPASPLFGWPVAGGS